MTLKFGSLSASCFASKIMPEMTYLHLTPVLNSLTIVLLSDSNCTGLAADAMLNFTPSKAVRASAYSAYAHHEMGPQADQIIFPSFS